MKPRYVPPRYLVRFPEGERELDALEIQNRFLEGTINTVIPVRPVSGGDWRELREDPELAVALSRCYKRLHGMAKWYPCLFWIFWITILLPFSMIFARPENWLLANWQYFLIQTGLNIPLILVLLIGMLNFPLLPPRSAKLLWLIVPYFNCIAGYRILSDNIDRLPPTKRRIPHLLNPVIWITLFLFLTGTLFLPGNIEGGIIIFSLYALFFILLAQISISLFAESKQRPKLWLEMNPTPEKKAGKSELATHLRKNRRTMSLHFLILYLAAIVAMLAMLTLPYWAVGSIRLRIVTAQLERNGISLAQPPGAPSAEDARITRELLAISFPAWPDCSGDDNAWTEQVRARLPEARPQLERFRQLLRATAEVSPLAPVPKEEEEALRKRLLNYLYWQNEELKANPRPEAAEQLLEDIANGFRYAAKKIPDQGIFTTYRYAVIHCRVLESWLRKLPDHTLATEKERWKRQLAALPEAVNAHALQQVQYVESFMLGMRVPFCYRNNIRATVLELAGEEIALLRQEYYRNHAEYDRFLRAYSRRSFFVTAFGMHTEEDTMNRFHSLTLAGCRMGIAAIELEEFRRKNGAYPEHPELPRDPFSGKPFGYLPGKAIYSVGPDGIDDGGRQEERHKNDSYDITFTL